ARTLRSHGIAVRGPSELVEKPNPAVVNFAGVNHLATAWAEQHAGKLVAAPADVQNQIRLLVAQANEQGIPPRELAKLIRDVVGLRDAQANAVMRFQERLVASDLREDVRAGRVERYAMAQRRSRALSIARTELIG